jgi:hypothetical protein
VKQTPQMGLGNTVDENTEILHSGVIGRAAFGRISDLVAAWCSRSQSLATKHVSDLRLMVQALLEFSHPKDQAQLGQFEFTVEDQHIFASVRFENQIFNETTSVERTLSQYWLNSEEASMLKKVLYPKDRVEVRFNEKLNLVEWRVCRSLVPESISHHDPSFLVMIDEMPAISSENKRYTDLGDLPYQNWLESVYKNTSTENRSGEFFVQGDSLQNESEWARVVVDRETDQVETEVRISSAKETSTDDEVVFQELSYEENEKINDKSRRYVEDLRAQLLSEQSEIKDQLKEMITEAKKKELRAVRETVLLQQKIRMFEGLLHKKELVVQKKQSEIRILNQKIADQSKEDDAHAQLEQIQAFRDKAIQMFEQLKKVKDQNQELEKMVIDFQHREKLQNTGKEAPAVNSVAHQQMEEMNKKYERMYRSLEAEKIKVKTLSDRVIVAEKEAQSAGPLIEDLEGKVENTLKIAQQHKKETEAMKLKLVQAEGEKNKVKNELMKAQAQIQTLMKRHAS